MLTEPQRNEKLHKQNMFKWHTQMYIWRYEKKIWLLFVQDNNAVTIKSSKFADCNTDVDVMEKRGAWSWKRQNL